MELNKCWESSMLPRPDPMRPASIPDGVGCVGTVGHTFLLYDDKLKALKREIVDIHLRCRETSAG